MAGRREERVPTELKVKLEGGEGTARNVSASGIYFLTDVPLRQGQPVELTLEFGDFPSGPLEVTCFARVVRLEKQGATTGVAATIGRFELRRIGEAGSGDDG